MGDSQDKKRLVIFPEGTVILREGEDSREMFKILNGHAELYTGYGTEHEVLYGVIGPQAVFGEFGLLLHKPALYTAVAYSEVYALRVSENEIAEFIMENHTNVMNIMKNMADSMIAMQKEIDMLTQELEEYKQLDPEKKKKLQRNIKGYAMYNNLLQKDIKKDAVSFVKKV